MDAAQALADLTEISSQVVAVAILDRDGSLLATTIPAPGVGARFVAGVGRLLEEAEREAQARGLGGALSQLEASTLEGSVFAVRSGGRLIAATTRPDPTVGLVLYDLKRCLESLDEAAAPGPARRRCAARPRGAARRTSRSPRREGARGRRRARPAASRGWTALRKTLTLSMLATGLVAGSVAYRRRTARRLERVELYAEDGSMASLTSDSHEAERLLSLARDLLALAR